jgi:hypothetical protein
VLQLLVSVQTVVRKILALTLVTCKVLDIQVFAHVQLQSVTPPSLKLALRALHQVSMHTVLVTSENRAIHKLQKRAVLTIDRHLTDINGCLVDGTGGISQSNTNRSFIKFSNGVNTTS